MAKNLVYDIHDKPKFGNLLIFALQQVLAILAATIAVPTIIGLPTQIPAAIFGAGVGTLIYQLFTKFKSPVFLGSSFAFISSLIAALAYGYCGIVLGSVVAGLVYVVIAIIIRFVGTNWVNKLMPPVIIGPTVAVIGLSLAGNAMGDLVKTNGALGPQTLLDNKTWEAIPKAIADGSPIATYNLIALLCGLVAFFTIVICSSQKRFQMPRLIPFIIGIVAGYATASVFTVIGNVAGIEYFKIINWQPVIDNFVTEEGAFRGIEAFFKLPDFALVEAIKELVTGSSSLIYTQDIQGSLTNVFSVIVAFLPVALVVFAEHIADHKNLSTIIDRDLIKDPGLSRTLLGDGVGSIGGTLFGICPNTTYGESVGCVAITRNASVVTITTAAIMCLALSFFSPLMVVLQTIPSCVMGGVCLTLYGFIAVSGLKMIKDVDLNENKNLFVVSAILIAGIGGLAVQIPYAFVDVDGVKAVSACIQVTSVATALILGIVTNAVLSRFDKKKND